LINLRNIVIQLFTIRVPSHDILARFLNGGGYKATSIQRGFFKKILLCAVCLILSLQGLCQRWDTYNLDFSDDCTTRPYKNPTVFLLSKKGTSVQVSTDVFEKDFLLKSQETSAGEIDFTGCRFSNARIISPDVNSNFISCHFKNLQITPDSDSRDDYRGAILIDTMMNKGNLDILDINLYKSIRISGRIKGVVTISNVHCKAADANIDLTGLKPYKDGDKIRINLVDAPYLSIKLDYEQFVIDTGVTNHPNQASVTYISMLNNFKRNGLTTAYQLLDIEYQHYRYTQVGTAWDRFWGRIADYIENYWWNYGYNKGRVLLWTIGFLLVFSILNLTVYRTLNDCVYAVKDMGLGNTYSFYDSLIYTSVVFFSVSLNMEKLKFGNKAYLIWFLFIYLIGVICLAYSVNFVLKGGA
jgi:hypothetical protein